MDLAAWWERIDAADELVDEGERDQRLAAIVAELEVAPAERVRRASRTPCPSTHPTVILGPLLRRNGAAASGRRRWRAVVDVRGRADQPHSAIARACEEVLRSSGLAERPTQTLTRAARDLEEKNPAFALEAGLAALRWLVEGYGYEVTGADVYAAYSHTMKAAERAGVADETHARIRALVSRETFGEHSVTRILGRYLELR